MRCVGRRCCSNSRCINLIWTLPVSALYFYFETYHCFCRLSYIDDESDVKEVKSRGEGWRWCRDDICPVIAFKNCIAGRGGHIVWAVQSMCLCTYLLLMFVSCGITFCAWPINTVFIIWLCVWQVSPQITFRFAWVVSLVVSQLWWSATAYSFYPWPNLSAWHNASLLLGTDRIVVWPHTVGSAPAGEECVWLAWAMLLSELSSLSRRQWQLQFFHVMPRMHAVHEQQSDGEERAM